MREMRQLDGTTDSMDMSLMSQGDIEGQGSLECFVVLQSVGHDLETKQQLIKSSKKVSIS